jgi:hypothetical protein
MPLIRSIRSKFIWPIDLMFIFIPVIFGVIIIGMACAPPAQPPTSSRQGWERTQSETLYRSIPDQHGVVCYRIDNNSNLFDCIKVR